MANHSLSLCEFHLSSAYVKVNLYSDSEFTGDLSGILLLEGTSCFFTRQSHSPTLYPPCSVFQLHCAGTINQKLLSYNIIFFPDSLTAALDLAKQLAICSPGSPGYGLQAPPISGDSKWAPPYGVGDLENVCSSRQSGSRKRITTVSTQL